MDQALEKLGMEPAKKGAIYKMNFADLFIGAEEDRVELSSAAANLQYTDSPEPAWQLGGGPGQGSSGQL